MHGTAMEPLFAVIAIPRWDSGSGSPGRCSWCWPCAPSRGSPARSCTISFPHWEWEKKLGWLNITAERRSEAILRWIGYFIHAGMAVALYGIVWAAPALGEFGSTDPAVIGDGASRLAVLLVCLTIWGLYLGGELIPKLRREHEQEELARYRAAHPELDDEEAAAARRSAYLANQSLFSSKPHSRR